MNNKICFLLLALALTVSACAFTGCRSTPIQTAITTEGVLITSVNTGMQVWKSYVIAHQSDGKVTQDQIDKVHQAYDAYYTAQQAAKAVIEKILANMSNDPTDLTNANMAVTSAENQLLNLLNSYIK